MVDQALLYDDTSALDPNVAQRQASDPEFSVWVGASAGSGKTKVLTDRVLRLLLPRADGRAGADAHKILCLTFTKAAASEMALRVSKILAKWSVMEEVSLVEKLSDLLGRAPSLEDIAAARRLFADVVDVPGGLKIMTIHSFCQSVLGRFPLEAGLSPQSKVLDDVEAAELLQRAQRNVMNGGDAEIAHALHALALQLNEDQFSSVLSGFVSRRRQFAESLTRHFGVDGLYNALCTALGVQAGISAEKIIAGACSDDAFDAPGLRRLAQAMLDQGGKHNTERGQRIADWLALPDTERARGANFTTYKRGFLKKTDYSPYDKPFYGKVLDVMPEAEDVAAREVQRLLDVQDQVNASETAVLTRDLCMVAERVLRFYEELKLREGGLDYDDLIFKTLDLLKGQRGAVSNSAWVQYKLDQGIDHILVDEAQDTNPEQWEIIEALADDFFAGESAQEDGRTIFVVGDEKQSIYSFQGASREEFSRMKTRFAEKIGASGFSWMPVGLDISFRSTRTVLRAVDAVFADDLVRSGVSENPTVHHAFRRGQAGLVEMWPLFEADELKDQYDFWDPPVEVQAMRSGSQKLADYTAGQIKGWIDSGEALPSHGRGIRAGDIMVLVRRRSAFVAQLSRALKSLGVSVGGVDRMVLGDQLVVQDLMAALRFALLPQDDLNLACLLKSPFIGLDEDGLFDLAYDRAGDLWSRVCVLAAPEVSSYLKELIRVSKKGGAYDFLSFILQSPCPADSVSGLRAIQRRLGVDALDALNEFLSVALAFQHKEGRSLQQFVYEQERKTSEIKRDQDEGGGFVRIMTVHGSKGLQAPIVILPDTVGGGKTAPNRASERVLWPRGERLGMPLWSPYKGLDTTLYRGEWQKADRLADDEYRRLLYVAMTRAEDRLYVAGYKGRGEPEEGCWYNLVRKGLSRLDEVESLDDGLMRLSYEQIASPDRSPVEVRGAAQGGALPDWLFEVIAPEDQTHMDVLQPSRLQEVALSPVSSEESEQRFLRGNLTHKLLQYLPDMDEAQRGLAAREFVARYGGGFSESVQEDIVRETLQVLLYPEFFHLFGPESRAEVPLSGVLEGQGFVSGQVDRLCVREDEVLVVDYKTNRPPPEDPADIPAAYQAQLAAYAGILRQIYPDKQIRCALLWTDGPRLMPVQIDEVG